MANFGVGMGVGRESTNVFFLRFTIYLHKAYYVCARHYLRGFIHLFF